MYHTLQLNKEQLVPRSWTVSGSSDVSVKAIDGVKLSFVEDTEGITNISTNTSIGTTTILAIVSIASVVILCGIVMFCYCCYRQRNNGKATFEDEQEKEPEVEISVEMEVEDRETHSMETNEEI